MNQQLLKSIIKTMLLTEAPIDVWKAKNRSLPSEQLSQAEKYFADLTGKYIASLHPVAKDLTSLSFEQLETLYKTVEASKNKNLKSEYVKWITKQLKQLPSLSLQQVIEDYIPPLLSLQKNKEKFDPNFLENLQSIEELNKALNQKASSGGLAATVPEEQFGKLAEENGWILYMPHTTEASCEIGKTGGRRDTTWCTTRPDPSNMFLQYSASHDRNIILFYVVKKGVNAETDPHAKMSVGFIDGNPEFNQGAGGVSVNASNDNLDQKKFEQVLGKDLANKFLQIMQEKAGSLKGEHPAKDEFRKLVQNPKAFQAKINSFAKDEDGQELRKNFIRDSLKYEETKPEVFNILVRDPDINVRTLVAGNPKTPREALAALARGKDVWIRSLVAENWNTPPETLADLAVGGGIDIRIALARNPNTPRETLAVLAVDKDEIVRSRVAVNEKTLPETLAVLARDKDVGVRINVAKNPKTLPKTLAALARDKEKNVHISVAQNPNTPPKTLAGFAALTGDIPRYIAKNTNLPTELFTALAGHRDKEVRRYIAANQKTPPKLLTFLAGDKEEEVQNELAHNPKTPRETLTVLSGHGSRYVRWAVARNSSTPPETLNALTGDEFPYIANSAKATLEMEALKAKPLVEAIIMEKVWRKLLRSI